MFLSVERSALQLLLRRGSDYLQILWEIKQLYHFDLCWYFRHVECIYAIYQRNQQVTVHPPPPPYINLSKMLLLITDSAWMLNKEILLPITGFVTLQIFILPFWLNDCDAITAPYVLKTIKNIKIKIVKFYTEVDIFECGVKMI